jgi:hypothetical protein
MEFMAWDRTCRRSDGMGPHMPSQRIGPLGKNSRDVRRSARLDRMQNAAAIGMERPADCFRRATPERSDLDNMLRTQIAYHRKQQRLGVRRQQRAVSGAGEIGDGLGKLRRLQQLGYRIGPIFDVDGGKRDIADR